MELGKEYFGPLWSFVASNEITDIDYNGKEIWLTNIFMSVSGPISSLSHSI